jgi:hypothetical protein
MTDSLTLNGLQTSGKRLSYDAGCTGEALLRVLFQLDALGVSAGEASQQNTQQQQTARTERKALVKRINLRIAATDACRERVRRIERVFFVRLTDRTAKQKSSQVATAQL